MILSFNTASNAISVEENKTVEALLFTPVGGIISKNRLVLNGGAMGQTVISDGPADLSY
jgi:hypothetical protein